MFPFGEETVGDHGRGILQARERDALRPAKRPAVGEPREIKGDKVTNMAGDFAFMKEKKAWHNTERDE